MRAVVAGRQAHERSVMAVRTALTLPSPGVPGECNQRAALLACKGFTLLELVVVMVVLAVVMAVAAPAMRNFWRGAEVRDEAEQFVAVARWAHERAASDGTVYRLNIDTSARTYQLTRQDGEEFVEVGSDFGRAFEMPREGTIELLEPRGQNWVDFFPDGRTQTALVRMFMNNQEVLAECASPSELFRVLSGEEAQRR